MQSKEEVAGATEKEYLPVSLWRRLAAVLYDGIMLICLIFIAWQPVPLLPDDNWPGWLSQGLRLIYLFAIAFLFFGWFWTHGGQTIGMRAWKIRLVTGQNHFSSGDSPPWSLALIRFTVAILSWLIFGFGFLWALTNRKRLCWHDLASKTFLIRLH